MVLVKFREGPPSDEARQQLERLGARIERVLPGIEVRRLRVPEGAEERVVEALRRTGGNQRRAARLLRLKETTLAAMRRRLKVEPDRT